MAKKIEQAAKANGKSKNGKSSKNLKKAQEAQEGKRAELHAKTIKVLAKENPRREGTRVFKLFEAMKSGQTVGEWLAATEKLGGKMGNLRKAEAKKWITLK